MVFFSKPILALAAFAASLPSGIASPVQNLAARQDNVLPVTGPTVGDVQPRLEIRDLQDNADMFNLFLLATRRFKEMNQDDKLSYFQISGIHGQPLVEWDNSASDGGNPAVGYCPHSSNLFGPWHRPYLSVYEQILSEKAGEIVNEFPNGPTKDHYGDLHSQLRMPYWDWAKRLSDNEPILPLAITQPSVSVTLPNGTEAEIENPLLLYRFHPLRPDYFSPPWQDAPTTLRNSDGSTSNPIQTESSLQGFSSSLKNTLYQILTQWQTYNQFSNHGSQPSVLGNLESLHDMIHGAFNRGHMSSVPAAAFDPVFWLHHANVDRLLAIWQHLYPDSYLEPFAASRPGTWTIAPGTIQDIDSPLTPFHRTAQGAYHTSASVRTTTAFAYTYPELVDAPSNATLKSRINTLYAPPVPATSNTTSLLTVSPANPRAFLAAIEAPLLLPGTYSVDLFLGPITSSPRTWTTDPNFVGAQTMMARVPSDAIVNGSVVLTPALTARYAAGHLASLETDDVVAYLRQNLRYRIRSGEDEIPRARLPRFKLRVLSTAVRPAASADEFPRFEGTWTEHADMTEG